MDTAEEWARREGLPRISLSVGAVNTIGQRLYQSLGYEVETLRMTKKLESVTDEFEVASE
jgi:ribosomal protein S18 acetylase RimI-like enzyme